MKPAKSQDEQEAISAEQFSQLEKDFHEVLEELVGDKSLEHFRTEYEKLHRALKRSHESEKRLIKKCRELNQDIVQNAVKVQTALKLSQEDQQRIAALKKEIERAWRMVETSHEKEQRANETINSLKSEADNLTRLVEQGAGKSITQENTVTTLIQQKQDLSKHKDLLQNQVTQLASAKVEFQEKTQKAKLDLQTQEKEVQRLQNELAARKSKSEEESQRKAQLSEELQSVRAKIEETGKEVERNKIELDEQKTIMREYESKVKNESDKVADGYVSQNRLEEAIKKTKKLYQEESGLREKLQDEAVEFSRKLKDTEHEAEWLLKQKKEVDKDIKEMEQFRTKLQADRKDQEALIADLKGQVQQMSKNVQALQKQAAVDAKAINDIIRERDVLTKNVAGCDDRGKKQIELVNQHEWQAQSLEKETIRWKLSLQNTLTRVSELEKLKDKYTKALKTAQTRNSNGNEAVKQKESKTLALNKAISDIKAKLHQQKNLYEAVRTDRNIYSKNLVEALEEIGSMKEKFRVMFQQIENLREEIREKDSELIKKHCDHVKVSRDMDRLSDQLDKTHRRQAQLQHITDMQRREIKKIEQTIQQAEFERVAQKKEIGAVQGQRNILATQLIKRNDELRLLYEKIRVQESTLAKGEVHYKLRWDESNRLKQKIDTLSSDVTRGHNDQYKSLNRELTNLERELFCEKHKVKCLSEELENPMNVHRWRKLEGSDPQVFALINKIKTLQTRIIEKTEKVAEKELLIHRKDKVYSDLKKILAHQPGPEIMDSLVLYQEHVKTKRAQCEKMTNELQLYQTKVQELKDELQRLHRQHVDVKKKLFEQKRKERGNTEADKKTIQIIQPQLPRFTGGGFNLSL